MKYLRRPSQNGTNGPVDPYLSLGGWAEQFPALCEFLVETKWEDGQVRKPGTVTLFFDDGAWKLCLNDKDSSCVAFVSAGSPLGTFEVAEAGLTGGALDWRIQKSFKGKRN